MLTKIVQTLHCLNKLFEWSQKNCNSRPSASNFKKISWSLEHFFLTIGQKNFGNKIPLFSLISRLHFFLFFSAPHLFRECCWKVEERGAVGESAFHVCFLMQTPTHLALSRRMLLHYPKLINDIYMSEEYYGKNFDYLC